MADVVDLNLWRLEYPGTVYEFGTHETSHPLTRQVQPGVVAAEYGDRPHPVSHGVIGGVDRTRGRVWVFAGAHLPKTQLPSANADRWPITLDLSSQLEAAWAAEDIAGDDGAVATLTNVDRDRTLYGRPRNYGPTLDKVRQGWAEWGAEFHAFDRRAYGPERVVNVTTVAGFVGGITAPLTAPVTTSSITDTRARIDAVGDLSAWPTVTVTGGTVNPTIELLDASGGQLWAVTLEGTVPVGRSAVIDTRPWSRGATIDGSSVDGWLRGDRLDDCRIPVGQSEVRFAATVPPGESVAAIMRWRDAFASL